MSVMTHVQLKPLRALTREINKIVRGPLRGHVLAFMNYDRGTIVVKIMNGSHYQYPALQFNSSMGVSHTAYKIVQSNPDLRPE